MAEIELAEVFLAKAEESLAGEQSELVNGRYNNCANRCYYACFQGAVASLMREGIDPPGSQWGHEFVQSQFVGQLINRRKRYPADLRDVLERLYDLRHVADYRGARVSATLAVRALRRARGFVQAIQGRGGSA